MTLPVEVNPTLLSGGGYNLQRSLRFRSSASAYLSRTPASTTNRTTWTWSAWVKRGAIGSATMGIWGVDGSTNYMFMILNNSGTNNELDCGELATTQQWRKQTTQVFRDASSWYHLVLAFDSTQATASNRVKIYVNGSQVTAFATSADPSLNYNSIVNTTTAHSIGRVALPTGFYFDGYLAEINFIDGQQLTPSSFGATNAATGVWQPAKYAGTYGTNGYYLPFTDNSGATSTTIGKDFSGNSNNWTPNNISVTAGVTYDSMTDVPTLTSPTAANYCTWNPVIPLNALSSTADGNLRITLGGIANTNANGALSTFRVNSGKWYAEFILTTITNGGLYPFVGITGSVSLATGNVSSNSASYAIRANGNIDALSSFNTAYGSSFANGDICMVAVDFDNGRIWYGKNGTWFASGNPATGANPSSSGISSSTLWGFATSGDGNAITDVNFGQRPFSYTPPSGYVALNTFNLSTPTIAKGAGYMNATLYTGTGASLSVTNSGSMKPDLVWIKSRSAATDHKWTDSNRGTTKALISNTSGAETTDTNGLTAFNTNGFTVGSDTTYNNSGATYVGWQWQAGQGTNVTNTAGSITSTVSASTTAGFSVVLYTGTGSAATVGHGLGVAPEMIIVKARNGGSTTWLVYQKYVDATTPAAYYLSLESTNARNALSNVWNNTAPTSSVFSEGGNASSGANAVNYVAYCFAPIAGFSAFGSYTGNGSTDGPFIYTGFRPRWIMFKTTNTAGNWFIRDTSRDVYNASTSSLYPNLADAEFSSAASLDIVSNGFKVRSSAAGINGSGDTMIYAAFAENPFKYSLAR